MSKHKHHEEENQVLNQSIPAEAGQEAAMQASAMQASATQTEPEQIVSSEEKVNRLEQELGNAQQAKDDYYNRMLRIQADFDNFRRRSKQEYEQICQFAGEDLMKKILPVLDSLERAINCFNSECPAGWQDGVQLTLKQFQEILKSEGLEAIPAQNAVFDPQVHEAISQEESSEVETAQVVAELQKGYKFRGRVIRPSLVKVAIPG